MCFINNKEIIPEEGDFTNLKTIDKKFKIKLSHDYKNIFSNNDLVNTLKTIDLNNEQYLFSNFMFPTHTKESADYSLTLLRFISLYGWEAFCRETSMVKRKGIYFFK
jgi:hypothetical protein